LPRVAVAADRTDRQRLAVDDRQVRDATAVGEGVVRQLEDALAVVAADAPRELTDRRQTPRRAEQRAAVTAATAGPAQRAVVPHRPDVHRDDQPVGVDWPPPPAVPPDLHGGAANRS